MKALITGASSGLGRDMARVLSEMGYDIIAVARREDKLLELKKELKTNVECVVCDVSTKEGAKSLFRFAEDTDILINNAGFGVFGTFADNELSDELKMLDTNVRAVHILTKLFLSEFKKKNKGYILNVASLAAFFPGPLFGAYYASKSYVLRLSQSIAEELRREKSNVKISVLCPGPVHTEFEQASGVSFGNGTEKVKGIILESRPVADYAIKKMFSGKEVIVPGFFMKAGVFSRHFLSDKVLAKALYTIQSKKIIK